MRVTTVVNLVVLLGLVSHAPADEFTILDDTGKTVTLEARLAATEQGLTVLERRDGRWEIVPNSQVRDRKPGDGPVPITPDEMLDNFRKEFGEDRVRGLSEPPFLVVLVLAAPLPKSAEVRVSGLLKKAGKFLKTVERVFDEFLKDVRLPSTEARYPLAMLIFETDDAFIEYARDVTGGRGLSAENIAGFYSALSNHLAIRLTECQTFETPLHEAVHQLVHNRGILPRLGGVPAWLNEGIATGFEGNGEKIAGGPLRINSRYARMTMNARAVDWPQVIADDGAFRGDVLAGEAYAHAWSLHWFLVTKLPSRYSEYLKRQGARSPLSRVTAQEREKEFAEVFGKPSAELQRDFADWLQVQSRKQRVLFDDLPVGVSKTVSNLAEVEMTAVRRLDNGGALEVEGRLKNISTLRPMSFHVTVETDGGAYADWYLPQVPTLKTVPLPKQNAIKRMKNSPGGPSSLFAVRVRAVVPESEEGQSWKRGELPIPVFGDR